MRLEIIVPRDNQELFDRRVVRPLSERFGGCTVDNVVGYWVNADNELVRDLGWRVVAYYWPVKDVNSDDVVDRHNVEQYFRTLAARVCGMWDQECVFIAFDNDHELIKGDYRG